MASAPRPGWPVRVRWLCLAAAAVGVLAGCVSMPDSGPVGDVTASPQASAPQGLIGPFANPPAPGGSPSQIVSGFLVASASYTTSAIAREYLAGPAARQWNPDSVTVLDEFNTSAPPTPPATGRRAAQRTTVTVNGSVLATFNGSGEYVSAQGQGAPGGQWTFDLVRVDGQWRITNPPSYRMLNQDEFSLYYKAQDLYFLGRPNPVGQPSRVLVPDSVLVPLGASASQLVISLVNALTQPPQPSWLANGASSAFPGKTQVLTPPSVDGATATVNLGGAVTSRTAAAILDQVAAQLVWTLTGSPASPSGIQSVVLEIDGHPWTPVTPPCPGDRDLSLFQTQSAYECYNPYGSSAPASFYYIDRGQLWSRCGSQARAQQESVGSVVPVISRTGVFNRPNCDSGFVLAPSVLPLPTQPRFLGTLAMAAVSPDGRYLAVVPAGRNAVYIGTLSGEAADFSATPRVSAAPDITSLSWDRDDDLWLAQNGDIRVLPAAGKEIPVSFDSAANVTALRAAPDGVRVALITSAGPLGAQLQLGAIGRASQVPNPRLPTAQTERITVAASPPLGPTITRPTALTWYGADNLLVLNAAGTGNALWEVPVDGQQAQQLPFTPAGTVSITADGSANVLVAGLADNYLDISTSLEGPWQPLGNQGQAPAYPG